MKALKTFSKTKLKQARLDKRLTLMEAAGLLKKGGAKIEFTTLSQYEDPEKPNAPRADDMPIISQVYNKSISYFYTENENE